jgi:hypothetical protein
LSLAAVLGTIVLIAVDAEPAHCFNGMYVTTASRVLRIFVLATTGTVFVYARGICRTADCMSASSIC